jgi:hypothetical protein
MDITEKVILRLIFKMFTKNQVSHTIRDALEKTNFIDFTSYASKTIKLIMIGKCSDLLLKKISQLKYIWNSTKFFEVASDLKINIKTLFQILMKLKPNRILLFHMQKENFQSNK